MKRLIFLLLSIPLVNLGFSQKIIYEYLRHGDPRVQKTIQDYPDKFSDHSYLDDQFILQNNEVAIGVYAPCFGETYSTTTRLDSSSANKYDSRFLGTWRTEDFKQFFVFSTAGSNDNPFQIDGYFYDKQKDGYSQMFKGENDKVYVTNFDTTYFMIGTKLMWSNGQTREFYAPARYKFINDTSMVITPLFQEYNKMPKDFNSTAEYRKFVRDNLNNNEMYYDDIYLKRMSADEDFSGRIIMNDNILIGLAGIAFILGTISILEAPNNQIYQSNYERPIEGYNKNHSPVYQGVGGINSSIYYDKYGKPVE